jgi:hypothetical protein
MESDRLMQLGSPAGRRATGAGSCARWRNSRVGRLGLSTKASPATGTAFAASLTSACQGIQSKYASAEELRMNMRGRYASAHAS